MANGSASRVSERAVRVGRSASLAGVLSEPAPDRGADTGVLILNSGVMHHIGTCRLSVKLARAAAAAGLPALRFDFSGIGDSEPRRDTLSFMESAPQETREAMDYLAQHKGARRFVLMGLCSGADMAYYAALLDARVVGMVQIDGYLYKTWQHYAHYYLPRMARPAVWRGFAHRKGRQLLEALRRRSLRAPAEELPEGLELPSYVRVTPPRQEVAAGLQRLASRGVNMYYIYTGIWGYSYPTQFQDAFRSVDFRGRLRVDWMPTADHIITGIDEQRRVVSEIGGWLERAFSPGRPAGEVSSGGSPRRWPAPADRGRP